MRRVVKDATGKTIRVDEAEPVCGKDLCWCCGECLRCYGGDYCEENDDGIHAWVVKEGDLGG